jgi:hypothetical protein
MTSGYSAAAGKADVLKPTEADRAPEVILPAANFVNET